MVYPKSGHAFTTNEAGSDPTGRSGEVTGRAVYERLLSNVDIRIGDPALQFKMRGRGGSASLRCW